VYVLLKSESHNIIRISPAELFVIADHDSDDEKVLGLAPFGERQFIKCSAIRMASLPSLVTASMTMLHFTLSVIIFMTLTQYQP
jgi:hypothetical protein